MKQQGIKVVPTGNSVIDSSSAVPEENDVGDLEEVEVDEDELDQQIDNSGNRDNLISTVARFNPKYGLVDGAVSINDELHEITLTNKDGDDVSWVLDDTIDHIKPSTTKRSHNQNKTNLFADQHVFWDLFLRFFTKRYEALQSNAMTVVAVGGRGAGKSYTLFGDGSHSSRGLIPRFIEYCFDAMSHSASGKLRIDSSYLQYSFYLIIGEEIVDILDGGNTHSYLGNLAYMDGLGPCVLPVRQVVIDNAINGLKLFHSAMTACAIFMANYTSIHLPIHIVNSITSFSTSRNRFSTTRFIEVGSMCDHCPKVVPKSLDRLSGLAMDYQSIRSLHAVGEFMLKRFKKIRKIKDKDSGSSKLDEERSLLAAEYSKSCLTYLLQDALYKRPDCLVIGCLRGSPDYFEENRACLDYLNQVDVVSEAAIPEDTDRRKGKGMSKANSIKRSINNAEEEDNNNDIIARESSLSSSIFKNIANNLRNAPDYFRHEFQRYQMKYEAETALETEFALKKFIKLRRDFLEQLKAKALTAMEDNISIDNQTTSSSITNNTNVTGSTKKKSQAVKLREEQLKKKAEIEEREVCKKKLDKLMTQQDKSDRGVLLNGAPRDRMSPPMGAHPNIKKSNYYATLAIFMWKQWLCSTFAVQNDVKTLKALFNTKNILHPKYAVEVVGALGYGGMAKPLMPPMGSQTQTQGTKQSNSADTAGDVNLHNRKNILESLGDVFNEYAGRPSSSDTSWLNESPHLTQILPDSLSELFSQIPLFKGSTIVRGSSLPILHRPQKLQPKDVMKAFDKMFFDEEFSWLAHDAQSFHVWFNADVSQVYRTTLQTREETSLKAELKVLSDRGALSSRAVNNYLKNISKSKFQQKQDPNDDLHSFKVVGTGLQIVHAVFQYKSDGNLLLQPIPIRAKRGEVPFAEVHVNDVRLTSEMVLQDGDIVRFGCDKFFLVTIPVRSMSEMLNSPPDEPINANSDSRPVSRGQPSTACLEQFIALRLEELSMWQQCMLRQGYGRLREMLVTCETDRMHNIHMEINRHIANVTRYYERTTLMNIPKFSPSQDFIDAIIHSFGTVDLCWYAENIYVADYVRALSKSFARGIDSSFKLKLLSDDDSSLSNSLTYNDEEYGLVTLMIKLPDGYLETIEIDTASVGTTADDTSISRNLTPFGGMGRRYLGLFRIEKKNGDNGVWWWKAGVMKERMGIMREVQSAFSSQWCGRDVSWLDRMHYDETDPFLDTADDELIGVSFVYLDPLQYLLDINDSYSIVNSFGYKSGAIQVHARCWIDFIDPLPSYISADNECHLKQFLNRKCIIRFYFENLMGLPHNLCAATHLTFKFFTHTIRYSTPRHDGSNVNPRIRTPIVIEQRINKDFIDFIMMGSIEIEVYGKRTTPTRIPSQPARYIDLPPSLLPKTISFAEETVAATPGSSMHGKKGEAASVSSVTPDPDSIVSTGKSHYHPFVEVLVGDVIVQYEPPELIMVEDEDGTIMTAAETNIPGGTVTTAEMIEEELMRDIQELEEELKDTKKNLQKSRKIVDTIASEKQVIIDATMEKLKKESKVSRDLAIDMDHASKEIKDLTVKNQRLQEYLEIRQRGGILNMFRKAKTYSEITANENNVESAACVIS